jgi:PEP-CTERM motif
MMFKNLARTALLLVLATMAISTAPIQAATFTFDPSQAVPALAGPGSAFTADTMVLTSHLHGVVHPPDSVTSVHQILTINGFTLGGAPVSAPGLNSSYGLYLEIFASVQPIAGVLTYSFIDLALKADVGYDDGTLSSTLAGLAYSNPAGTANDITLATGSLISASLMFNPATGVRNVHYADTFTSAPGETGFINSQSGRIDIFLTTLPGDFAAPPQPDGTTVQLVNGATGTASLQIPEPSTLVLVLAGLLAFAFAPRGFRRLA